MRRRISRLWMLTAIASVMPLAGLGFWGLINPLSLEGETSHPKTADATFPQSAAELQTLIDSTLPYGTVTCDRNRELTISTPIRVRKALTIRGLAARLPDGLGKTPLMVIDAESVTVTDFALRGNADTVEQSQRDSMLVFYAGNFRVENGKFDNVSRNGVSIQPSKESPREIRGGVVRDLIGHDVYRDIVSISGGDGGTVVRDVLVENIRGYRSKLRGPVEVSDGTFNITVRSVYAEDCVYGVDIQDHGNPKQVNVNVLVDNLTTVRCRHAVRMAVKDHGHRDITLKDITAFDNKQPLHLRNASRLTVTNVRILGSEEKQSPITLTNSHGVILRDLFLERVTHADSLIRVEKSDHVLVDGLIYGDEIGKLKSAVALDQPLNSATSFVELRNIIAGRIRGSLPDAKSKDAGIDPKSTPKEASPNNGSR